LPLLITFVIDVLVMWFQVWLDHTFSCNGMYVTKLSPQIQRKEKNHV